MDKDQFLSIKSEQDSIYASIGSELATEFRKIMPDASIGCFAPGKGSPQTNVQIFVIYNFEWRRSDGYCSIKINIEDNLVTYSLEYENFWNPKKETYEYDLNNPKSIDDILTRFRNQAHNLYAITDGTLEP